MVDVSGIAGGDINVLKGAINQQMTCTTTLEKQISDAANTDTAAGGTNAGTPTPPAPVAPLPIITPKIQPVKPTKKDNTGTYVVVGIIILILIIIGIVIALLLSGEEEVPPLPTPPVKD
jgi:hypothetical protein